MAPKLDNQTLSAVFKSRPDILDGIQKAADSPSRVTLFNNIASFVQAQLSSGATIPADEPASKRRRIDESSSTNGHASSQQALRPANGVANGIDTAANEQVLLEIKDISVVAPQRKKFDLCFTSSFLYARAPGLSAPVPGIVYAWRDIEHAFYLPVPEKSQVQHNYVLFPRNSYLPGKAGTGPDAPEPLVFTVPATAPKPSSIGGPSAAAAAAVSDTYGTLLHWALTTSLHAAGNTICTQVVSADPRVFHSAVRQAYRPAEKAVHVKAFRGSKDGFLFFLPTGILWGFKKPLLFLPLDRIVAVSYTSVLQRTFNIVVEMDYPSSGGGGGEKNEEIEFAMLDQEDYGNIDETYVRRHGLADRSMAERRRAKPELVENLKRGGGAAGEDGDAQQGGDDGNGASGDGMTELQRAEMEAEQQLQDEEDELEEDYDPGSDGESEGEGESSDEDDDDDEDGEEEEEGEEFDDEEEGGGDEGDETLGMEE